VFTAVSKNEKHLHPNWPVKPTGNAYLVVWKVGMTHTHANKNEEQPGGFAGRTNS